MNKETVKDLLSRRKTKVLQFTSKKGTHYAASLVLDNHFKLSMEFANKK